MDAEQHAEWIALSEAARDALASGNWSLRLGFFPSFEDAWTIGLAKTAGRGEVGYEVRARIWRRGTDFDKFRTPVERLRYPRSLPPTIDSAAAPIERPLAEQIIASLQEVRIPAVPKERPCGADGVAHELFAGDAFCSCAFRWWSVPPEGWRPLAAWWGTTWAALLDALGVPIGERPRLVDRSAARGES